MQQHRGFSFRCHFRAGGGTSASTSATATGCRCGTCRCFWCFSRIFRNFGKFFLSLLGVMKLTKNQRIELTQTLPKLDDTIKIAMQLQAPMQSTNPIIFAEHGSIRFQLPLPCLAECLNTLRQYSNLFWRVFSFVLFSRLLLQTHTHRHSNTPHALDLDCFEWKIRGECNKRNSNTFCILAH